MNCHDFLESALKICHRMAITPALSDEYNKHQSTSFTIWRRRMYAAKKVVMLETPHEDAGLRKAIAKSNDLSKPEMLKDAHLVEAALETDNIVISLDKNAKRRFSTLVARGKCKSIAHVNWVNPDFDPASTAEKPVDWLKKGAPLEPGRSLGKN